MIVEKLLNNAKAGGYTYHVKITADDLTETTANTAQTIELITVAQGSVVQSVAYNMPVPFKDASDSALNTTTLEIGDDGNTDRFMVSTELNVNGTEILAFASANDVNTLPYVYLAANTIDAVFGSMAAKSLSNVDTGEIDILVNVVHIGEYR